MGVYFIGNDDLLALVRVVFADACAGEEGFAVDVGRLSGLLGGLTVGAGAAIGVLLLVVGIALFAVDVVVVNDLISVDHVRIVIADRERTRTPFHRIGKLIRHSDAGHLSVVGSGCLIADNQLPVREQRESGFLIVHICGMIRIQRGLAETGRRLFLLRLENQRTVIGQLLNALDRTVIILEEFLFYYKVLIYLLFMLLTMLKN